jgi:hypothetical protein
MRSSAPAQAREWRLAVRSVLGPALRRGYELATVTRDGFCVLAQPGAVTH